MGRRGFDPGLSIAMTCLLCAALLLPGLAPRGAAARAPEAGAAADNAVVQKGMRIEYSIASLDGGDLVEGRYATVDFRISDASTGKPLSRLNPGAWIDLAPGKAGGGEPASCRDRIGTYLKGIVGMRPVLDLNSYYLLVMNRDPSISVIDPLVGFTGKTSLLASIRLAGPGADWTKSGDHKRLYVSMPKAGKVAAVDTDSFRVTANIDAGPEPVRVVLQPDEAYLWVGNDAREAGQGGVTVVDPREGRVVARIPTGRGHHEIAFSPDSRHAYVTNRDDGTVTVVDARGLKKIKDLATGPLPISLGYSALSEALYVADGTAGTVSVVDGARHEIVSRIEVAPGLGPMAVTRDGRFALIVNSAGGAVYAVDAAANRLARTLPVGAKPYEIVLSRAFAFVRSLESERVATINLVELLEGRDPPVSGFPAGASAPGAEAQLGLGPTIAPAVGEAAAFVVNPSDGTIYYYMEGMNFPTRNYRTYGSAPSSVTIVDRSLRERAPGVYSNTFKVPAAGSYDVAFILNSPSVLICFGMTAGVDPAVRRDGPASEVEFLARDRDVRVGDTVPVRFRLTDPATGRAKTGVTDAAILYYAMPGVGKTRVPAKEVAPGIYEAPVIVRAPGAHYVHVVSPALKGNAAGLRLLTLIGRRGENDAPRPGARDAAD